MTDPIEIMLELDKEKAALRTERDALAAELAALKVTHRDAAVKRCQAEAACIRRIAALEVALNEVTEARQKELAYVQKAVRAAIKDRANARVEMDDLLAWATNCATAFPFRGLPAERGKEPGCTCGSTTHLLHRHGCALGRPL